MCGQGFVLQSEEEHRCDVCPGGNGQAEIMRSISIIGSQIFSRKSEVLLAYDSTTCIAFQPRSQPHQGTLLAHPI